MTSHFPTATLAAHSASQTEGGEPAGTADPSNDAESADAFQQIEAGFARGDADLGTYEIAQRRPVNR